VFRAGIVAGNPTTPVSASLILTQASAIRFDPNEREVASDELKRSATSRPGRGHVMVGA
jgi:hypothetical protein